jgi:serine/threonine protein kinase
LADFGFAIRASHIFKDISVGSPVYMSPEGLINNLYGPKTDVWAFGILLYELLHGVAPLATCKSEEELKRKVMEPPIFTIDCSQDLKELILSCLTVQEKERPSVRLLGESSYMQRARREIEGDMELEKDLTSTIFSSEASRSEPPLPSLPLLSYDSAVSLIHYCRLFNKIRKMCVPSAIFSRCLFWLSSQLTRAAISMENVSVEKQTNLRAIIKEYHDKYEGEFGRMEAGFKFTSMMGECERKMMGEPRMLNHLKFLEKESEHLVRSLESGSIDHFFKRSKAKQYLNTISTR